MQNEKVRMGIAAAIVLVLGILLVYALIPFWAALVGSLILFVLFKPVFRIFNQRLGWKRSVSAAAVLLIIAVIVLVPILILSGNFIRQAGNVYRSLQDFQSPGDINLPGFLPDSLQEAIRNALEDIPQELASFMQGALISTFASAAHIVISIVIMAFALYYMFTREMSMNNIAKSLIPFSKKNTDRLVEEFRNVANATIFSSGIIAIIQGILVWIGFMIVGLPGGLFWGFVAGVFSFVPLLGPPLIWIPATVYLYLTGSTWMWIFMLIWGIFISNIDNVIRPFLNQGIGRIHPFATLLGVFAGLSAFGLIGIFVGPLLIIYFFLTLRMFREEFIDKKS